MAAIAFAKRAISSGRPRNSMNFLASSRFLPLALAARPAPRPAGILSWPGWSLAGNAKVPIWLGAFAAFLIDVAVGETWTAIAALPLATIAVCCSNVVPFGFGLK